MSADKSLAVALTELLEELRMKTEYSHEATMPIPLYEKAKGLLKKAAQQALEVGDINDEVQKAYVAACALVDKNVKTVSFIYGTTKYTLSQQRLGRKVRDQQERIAKLEAACAYILLVAKGYANSLKADNVTHDFARIRNSAQEALQQEKD